MRLDADTVSAIQLAVRLVNSTRHPKSPATAEQPRAVCAEANLMRGRDADVAEELMEVQAILPQIEQLLTSDELDIVNLINGILRDNGQPLQLVGRGEGEWVIQPEVRGRTLAAHILMASAMAMIEVVKCGELSRIGVCSAYGCDALTFDWSKNKSRRFCSATCSTREAVAAYRSRRRRPNVAHTELDLRPHPVPSSRPNPHED